LALPLQPFLRVFLKIALYIYNIIKDKKNYLLIKLLLKFLKPSVLNFIESETLLTLEKRLGQSS